MEHPWAGAGLESFITLSPWGDFIGSEEKGRSSGCHICFTAIDNGSLLEDDVCRNSLDFRGAHVLWL